MLAIVSQDGFLRVFHYDTMELLGIARSYFGGFLCVCWSPDGKYIVVGGEDDLVTVWSLHERRVVARGQGHRSWVSVVAFDPYTSYSNWDGPDFSDDENPVSDGFGSSSRTAEASKTTYYSNDTHHSHSSDVDRESIPVLGKRPKSGSFRDSLVPDKLATSYRLGSVGQDTQLCLWDITEDVLRQSHEIRQRLSSHDPQPVVNGDVVGGGSSSSGSGSQPNNDAKVIGGKTTTGGSVVGNSTVTKVDTIDGSSNSKSSSNSSNKSGSKFTTANCTSSSDSGRSSVNEISKHLNSSIKNSGNSSVKTNVMGNSVLTIGNSVGTAKVENSSEVGPSKTGTGSNSKTSDSGLTAFNSITQRLSNFSFGNDKRSSDGGHNGHKKTFTFSKSTGNHTGFLHSNNNSGGSGSGSATDNNASATSAKNSKNSSNSVVPSYDPMKLIGSAACPRFDECPLLEPLVCKKIAHERLTALIFREDCFLTACQDGFIYTWARPGFSSDLYYSKVSSF